MSIKLTPLRFLEKVKKIMTENPSAALSSKGAISINSDIGDINFQAADVNQLSLDLDGTAGDIIVKLMVDGDDLVFKQYDGTEVLRLTDGGNVGIGGDPDTTLHVQAVDPRIRADATAGNHPGFELSEAGSRKWVIYNDPDDSDNLIFKSGTTRFKITATGEVLSTGPLKIKEAAAAVADTAAYGQLWIKTATPNQLYFTNDAGNDIQLTNDSQAAAGAVSNLWSPPLTAHASDDEFNSTSIDSDWNSFNQGLDATAFLDTDNAPDYYAAVTNVLYIRVASNPTHRPSWLQVQAPAKSFYYSITKAYTFPTNVLIYCRFKFTQRNIANVVNNDGTVGLTISANNSGDPDVDNLCQLYMNEPDGTAIKAAAWKKEGGGSFAQIGTDTTDTNDAGQALEYAAIHKVGSNYYFWVGTESNWIYLGTTTLSFTPARVGFVFQNVASPPTNVAGVDFIRFIETDKFVL